MCGCHTRRPAFTFCQNRCPNEQAIFLADILPTGFEIGVQNGQVKPGDTVVVVGAGPVGLSAIRTAGLYGAATVIAVDLSETRLKRSTGFGADETIDSGRQDVRERVMELTNGLGANVAIEAVGIPATFELCTQLVRPGGHIANVGVHGEPVTLHLEDLWISNVTMTTGLVNGTTIAMLIDLVASGKIDVRPFGTHTFGLDQMVDAYDVFAHADTYDALKVVISR